MKKKFLQISNDLIRSSLSKNELAFIFRTKIHAIIVFNIFGSEKITFEDLCKNLNSVASRTTIQSILIDGVNKNYLSKEVNRSDKRKMAVDISDLIQAETTRRADFHRSHGRL